jgi:hypothetical protein
MISSFLVNMCFTQRCTLSIDPLERADDPVTGGFVSRKYPANLKLDKGMCASAHLKSTAP